MEDPELGTKNIYCVDKSDLRAVTHSENEQNAAAFMGNDDLKDAPKDELILPANRCADKFLTNKKVLVIANVSKKPNMKTLIYSAAAHDFNVAIVGLPNMDISDLHISEEITGAANSDLNSRDGWRNNNNCNKSDCANMNKIDSSSTSIGDHENAQNPEGITVCQQFDHNVESEVVFSAHISVDSSSSSSSSSSSCSSSSCRNVTTSDQQKLSGSQPGSDFSITAAAKKNFCTILRFETLKELKSFLESKEIKLFGIEIMDEGDEHTT